MIASAMGVLASEVPVGNFILAYETGSSHRDSSQGVRIGNESGSPSLVGPYYLVYNVCQFAHATFSVVRDAPNLNTLYTRVYWDMGDGKNYDYTIPSLNPLPVNDAWMTVLHRYQQPGRYNVKMRLYFGNNQSILYSRDVDIMPKPAMPVAPDTIDYCRGASATALSATGGAGNTLTWYAPKPPPATGWNSGPAAPVPTTSVDGTQMYQVTQTIPEGCESDPKTIIVKVSSTPIDASLTIVPPVYCEDATAQPLSASVTGLTYRTSLRWYLTSDPSESPLPSAPVPGTNATSLPGRSYHVSLYSTIGCGESARREVPVKVYPRPAAPSGAAADLCQDQASPLLPTVNASPGHTLRWYGTNATGGAYSLSPPVPSVSTVGTANYYVSQLLQYTNPSIGCESRRTAILVTVHGIPTATVAGDAIVCQDATSTRITFQGSGGNLPYSFTYTLNNGAAQAVASQNGSSSREIDVPTAAGGLMKYDLISVSDVYGCTRRLTASSTVRVLATPDASISGPAEACAASSKSLTITGTQGTAPYTFSYQRDNGTLESVVTAGSLSSAVVALSTAQPGTQNISLRKVSYTVSGTTCEKTLSRDHVFKVLPSPMLSASILNYAGSSLSLCQNSPSPTVRLGFTDGEAPYSVSYRYRGSLQQVTVPTGQMELTFPIATAAPGLHDFELVEIRDVKGCNRTYANDRTTVTILATPDASISGTTQLCMYAGTAPVAFSGTNGKAPYTFTYTLNGGAPLTVSSAAGAANATLQAPSDVSGSFEYRLVRVSYTDGITCSKDLAGAATVTINASPVLPTVTGAAFCQGTAGASLPNVTPIAGTTLRWYGTSATGGSWTATPPIPPTGTVGLTSYYVSQYNPGTGCEGQRAEIPVRIHPLPEAVLGPGAVVCQSTPDPILTFTGSKGTSPYKFTYRINGGALLNAVTAAGSSTASLGISTVSAINTSYELQEIEDANGCRQAQSGTSVFRVLATPDATLSAPADICMTSNASTTFTANSGKAPFTFTYTLNGGTEQTVVTANGANIAKVDIPNAVVGSQTFRLTRVSYSDGTTCAKDLSQDVSITVNPLPLASVGIVGQTAGSLLLCQGSPSPGIQLNGSVGAAPYTFSYSLNGAPQTATTVTGPSITLPVSTLSDGTFLYVLGMVTDARGCASNVSGQSATVRILSNPGATLKGAVKVCEKDAEPILTFKGNMGTAPYRFTYTLNGGTDLVILTPAGTDFTTLRAPTSVPGTFRYRLKEVSYTDGITCSSSLADEAVVTVHDLPSGTIKSTSPDIEICQLQPSPELLFAGQGGTPPYTFRYRKNNDILTSTGHPFIEKTSTQTAGTTLYELLEVQDARLCRQAQSRMVKVTVHPTPVSDAGPDKIMLENTGITLDGSAYNGNGIRYQWTPSASLSDPSIPKPFATPVQDTRYLLTATSDKGCTDTSSMLVKVLFKPVIPNTFTPNGDGYNDRWEILNLGAYPEAIVEIYNDRGHLLMRSSGAYRPWDGTYKGMPLPVGTYYYVIHPRSGRDKVAGYITILR